MSEAPDWFERDLIVASNDRERASVRHAQSVLRLEETGDMDGPTRAALRGFQGLFGLRMTGMLDRATAVKIEEIRNRYA